MALQEFALDATGTRRVVALLLLALGIIEASVVGCGGIFTPTTSRPLVTPGRASIKQRWESQAIQ